MSIPAKLQTGLRLPVIAAPMFLTSGPQLVIESCKAGVIGTFPALNQRTTEGLVEWLGEIKAALDAHEKSAGRKPAPFGVNLIVHKTNPRLTADLDACVAHQVPLVITSLGAAHEVVDKVHSYGGCVFHDVTTTRHARKAAEAGADGLILVCAGAGGHAGSWSPFAFVSEVRQFFQGAIVLAGAISTGRDIAAARVMGADFAYMGTRFIATRESLVTEQNKKMIVDATAADILYTAAISGVPANFLRASIVNAGMDPDRLVLQPGTDLTHVTDPYRKDHQEAKAWRDVWSAGQGVTSIRDVPATSELVARLVDEYRAAIAECGSWK